jgi:predicted transcriptional regulator
MQEKLSADNRFAIIPEWVIQLNISHTAFRLYAVLARYADNITHEAFPARATLAKRLDCSEKTIDRAIEDLIEHGAIKKQSRGRYASALYTVMTAGPFQTDMSKGRTEVSDEETKMSERVDKNDYLTITTELDPLNDINSDSDLPQYFNDFWEIYPRKMGKGEAKAAFVKQVKRFGHEVILEGVRKLASDPNLPAPQFVPRAATWLNQERWDDEPYPVPDVASIPGVQRGAKSPYVGGPREWVRDMHDMGEHWECRPGEFGCK